MDEQLLDTPGVRRAVATIAQEGAKQLARSIINRLEILEIGATATPPMSRTAMVAHVRALLETLREVVR